MPGVPAPPPASFRLGELAAAVGGRVRGNAELRISGIHSLEKAGPEHLSFVTRAAFRDRLAASGAGALLIPESLAAELEDSRPLLLTEDPQLALVELLPFFHPPLEQPAGAHETAVIGEGCEVAETARLGPFSVLGDGSSVGPGAVLHAHVVVGRDCRIGAAAVLHPHVVLYDGTEIGERTILHAGVVLGADGFGYVTRSGEHIKVPQVGRTVVESDVEIGALAAVDRAALDETRIGAGTKIDNLVQVGHNTKIGRGCILSGQSGIAGSARLQDYVVIAGQAGVAGHLEIGRGVQVAAKSAVLQSVSEGKVGGIPAFDLSKWRRTAAMLPRLGELARRVRALEKKVESADKE